MSDWKMLTLLVAVFLAVYFIPFDSGRVQGAIAEAFLLLQEYAREHVLFCLIPAFFIAGAMSVFLRQESVMRYFGAKAKKWVSYSIASVSGTILAVCSCTVLPLFAGIYTRGAGIGPATAFLYSGPAINVLAIILTARILGWQLGVARAVGAILFSVIIGLLMAVIFRRSESEREIAEMSVPDGGGEKGRSGWITFLFLLNLVLIMIFAASSPGNEQLCSCRGFQLLAWIYAGGQWSSMATRIIALIYAMKWYLTAILLLTLGAMLVKWFKREESVEWIHATWGFARQILPLLFGGVLVAGVLMGRPGTGAGLIPADYINRIVGGNSVASNLVASVVGALMYFATLTEIPILQGLLGNGMGQGPALALLLAGPALSLPNMLVIRSVLGTKKTLTFVALVIIMATITGLIFGNLVGS